MISFYEVLGVPRTASHAELKEAYHAAVLRAHPDKAPGASSTSDAHPFKFHDIQRAWEASWGAAQLASPQRAYARLLQPPGPCLGVGCVKIQRGAMNLGWICGHGQRRS